MLKIKLVRRGVIKKPFYQIIVGEKRLKMSGKAFEVLGNWQPSKNLKTIDTKKIQEWVKKGAQITPAVKKLLE